MPSGPGAFGSGSVGLADDATFTGADRAASIDKLSRLEARDDARYAKGALQQARLALANGDFTGPIEDADAVVREPSRSLARRWRWQTGSSNVASVQTELFATQRRLTAMRERANAQRRALEALMRDQGFACSRGGEQQLMLRSYLFAHSVRLVGFGVRGPASDAGLRTRCSWVSGR